MKSRPLVLSLVALSLLAGCTYEGLRSSERRQCIAMPQSASQRCLQRTAMTKAEYEAGRSELRRSLEKVPVKPAGAEPDPRDELWIP